MANPNSSDIRDAIELALDRSFSRTPVIMNAEGFDIEVSVEYDLREEVNGVDVRWKERST